MSEYLNNKEYKQQILKGLIKDLHSGRNFDAVKREFNDLVKEVDATEIASMEQQLISEGMPPEEIKKLCDVHAAVFRDSLLNNQQPELIPGHPLHIVKHENDEARKTLDSIAEGIEALSQVREDRTTILEDLKEKVSFFRSNLDKHFSKKENIFFPYLEKRNITGPPSVMWSVDDEIRDMVKSFKKLVNKWDPGNSRELDEMKDSFIKMRDRVTEMFFKEENILTPMMQNALSEEEWAEIKEQSSEFGMIFSDPGAGIWKAESVSNTQARPQRDDKGLGLDTGSLTPAEINAILTNLPIDITFVGKDDTVRYFSQGKERIFTRTKSIIGRKVQNCHPPESVHVVEKIVSDFKTGKHSNAEFWLELNGSFIHIRYLALMDSEGEYMGTMEVSMDLTRLRALQGERRLLQYEDMRH
ncbi:MAG: histidine kinase [Peptococcaceae bacterium BRH_c4a]|nr:MAG: histidine kinase [Peptococcaceae bacterium BRH_c4a]